MQIEVRQGTDSLGLGETGKVGPCQVRVDIGEDERREHWECWGIAVREVRAVGPNGAIRKPYAGGPVLLETEGDRWLRIELYGELNGEHMQLLAISSPVYFE